MVRIGSFIALTIVFVTACTDESDKTDVSQKSPVEKGIFNMNILFTEAERNVSFPIWFNDSIISNKKIEKITRMLYLIDEEDYRTDANLENITPREKREYWFLPNGELNKYKVSYYYDDQEIGTVSFQYNGKKDPYGYAIVSRVSDTLIRTTSDEDDLYFYHNIHQKIKYNGKYLHFINSHTGDKLFYMLQKEFWGPLSVDSIIKPAPKDIVILGNTYYPTKQYRVRNKVNEMDVVLYNYKKGSQMVESIIRFEYPFEIRRSFLIDEKGGFNGYIDSTFSNEIYLTKTLSEIKFNSKNLPVRITRKKQNQLNKNSRITIESFTYE